MKTGILIHAYHLDTVGWQDLIWGFPEDDRLGSGPLLVWLLLTEPQDAPITKVVLGCGPSRRNGMNEGEFTKQFLLSRFDELDQFPRLRPLLHALTGSEREVLRARLQDIIVTPEIRRTMDEIATAATLFADGGVHQVIQIAATSHAPRCIQIQATTRAQGGIPTDQQWFVIPSDVGFNGARPDETVIIEPPHRGDYALTYEKPTLAELLKPTLYMPDDDKRALIALVKGFVERRQVDND